MWMLCLKHLNGKVILDRRLKSLELGERSGWERNTAFCKKCLGRLYRMLGMRATDIDERNSFFQRSIDSLKQAITISRGWKSSAPIALRSVTATVLWHAHS